MSSESILSIIETFDLIGSTTILGVFYGITFVLYCLCAWSLYPNLQKPEKQLQARRSLANISFLFVCATALFAVDAHSIQLAYINYADFPGGPFGYEGSFTSSTETYIITLSIISLIVEISTMVIQIRRLWIIWGRTQSAVAVIILPVLFVLSYIAMIIPMDLVETVIPIDQLGISPTANIAIMTTAYATLSGFTILVTGLIIGRLLLVRRQHRKIMGMSEEGSPYLSIVAVLVESYTLDAAWSLATAISYGLGAPSELMLGTSDSIIKIIAYFLVVYRVETGRGWTKQTGKKLTSLQWNRRAQTANSKASDIQSQVPATTTIATIDSPPTTHSDSAI